MISEDEKNILIDLSKSEGWTYLQEQNKIKIQEYRRLATQPPESVSEGRRTWYSALAAGREELEQDLQELIQ